MKRPKIGDIIEIPTSNGVAYCQFTHKNKEFGHLLRVFNTIYSSRPDNIYELISQKQPDFSCFFPLGAAVNRHIVTIVDHCEVREEFKKFPVFRAASGRDPLTGKVDTWWLWDGETEWFVGEITAEQRKFPIRSILNDTALISRIERGWTAETDPS